MYGESYDAILQIRRSVYDHRLLSVFNFVSRWSLAKVRHFYISGPRKIGWCSKDKLACFFKQLCLREIGSSSLSQILFLLSTFVRSASCTRHLILLRYLLTIEIVAIVSILMQPTSIQTLSSWLCAKPFSLSSIEWYWNLLYSASKHGDPWVRTPDKRCMCILIWYLPLPTLLRAPIMDKAISDWYLIIWPEME